MKFIAAQNVRFHYTHRRKLYRVSDVLEEGYNELNNVAKNLASTRITQTYTCLLICWLRSFFIVETLIVYGPPVSYLVLALFFTISTLRLTGLAARGLRYRYGEKISL